MALKYNEPVRNNHRIFSRLIQIICYFGKQELSFQGHDENKTSINRVNYSELLYLLFREQ